ncbi:MAG TPA: hypothetical protein V6C88_12735 [Chroococcidiopsis sp.]
MRILPGKRYVNLKTGDTYTVLLHGYDSEDGQQRVVYCRSQSPTRPLKHALALLLIQIAELLLDAEVWVRPFSLFQQKFRDE